MARNRPQRQKPLARFFDLSFFTRSPQITQSAPRSGVRPHTTQSPLARQRVRSRRCRSRLSDRQAEQRRRPDEIAASQIVQTLRAWQSATRRLLAERAVAGLYRCRALSRQRTQFVWPSMAALPHRTQRFFARRSETSRRLNSLLRFARHASQYQRR